MISSWRLNEHRGRSKKRIYEFTYKLKTASVNKIKMFSTETGNMIDKHFPITINKRQKVI